MDFSRLLGVSLESDARANKQRQRPARALAVHVTQTFFDQPVDIRQSPQEAQLSLGDDLDRPDREPNAAGWSEAERPGLFEELAVLCGEARCDARRHADERAANVLVTVDADEPAGKRGEPCTRKEEPLAPFEAPVLVFGEVHVQRGWRSGASGADLNRLGTRGT